MVCPFVSISYGDSRTHKCSSSATMSWLEGLGSMNGGYENPITVVITHPLYHDLLLSVTASFIILLEQRSHGHSVGFTAMS